MLSCGGTFSLTNSFVQRSLIVCGTPEFGGVRDHDMPRLNYWGIVGSSIFPPSAFFAQMWRERGGAPRSACAAQMATAFLGPPTLSLGNSLELT